MAKSVKKKALKEASNIYHSIMAASVKGNPKSTKKDATNKKSSYRCNVEILNLMSLQWVRFPYTSQKTYFNNFGVSAPWKSRTLKFKEAFWLLFYFMHGRTRI
jgi:vacuolar-type H+-ATPase subunit D/Vma8